MATFNTSFSTEARFNASLADSNGGMTASFGDVEVISTADYEQLYNKPSIEGVVLVGDKTIGDFGVRDITPQEIDEIIYGG